MYIVHTCEAAGRYGHRCRLTGRAGSHAGSHGRGRGCGRNTTEPTEPGAPVLGKLYGERRVVDTEVHVVRALKVRILNVLAICYKA